MKRHTWTEPLVGLDPDLGFLILPGEDSFEICELSHQKKDMEISGM